MVQGCTGREAFQKLAWEYLNSWKPEREARTAEERWLLYADYGIIITVRATADLTLSLCEGETRGRQWNGSRQVLTFWSVCYARRVRKTNCCVATKTDGSALCPVLFLFVLCTSSSPSISAFLHTHTRTESIWTVTELKRLQPLVCCVSIVCVWLFHAQNGSPINGREKVLLPLAVPMQGATRYTTGVQQGTHSRHKQPPSSWLRLLLLLEFDASVILRRASPNDSWDNEQTQREAFNWRFSDEELRTLVVLSLFSSCFRTGHSVWGLATACRRLAANKQVHHPSWSMKFNAQGAGQLLVVVVFRYFLPQTAHPPRIINRTLAPFHAAYQGVQGRRISSEEVTSWLWSKSYLNPTCSPHHWRSSQSPSGRSRWPVAYN